MNKIGIIGAGTMGIGVGQAFVESGISIVLIDKNETILNYANEQIKKNISFGALMYGKKIKIAYEEIDDYIVTSTNYNILGDMDFIIENVTENWDVKEDVYKSLEEVCKSSCIYMVNTSCISITKIASKTKRAERIIGTHFMNPVAMIDAVETIRGYHTSEETILKVDNLLKSIGKESILVNDYPGFVSNRVSHMFMNEAAFLVYEQVAEAKDVDNIFKKCYGHKMGPLETADLIGLDTVMDSLNVLYESYQDPKFKCCPLIKKLVYAGRYGRKVGKGFYDYI